MFHSDVVRFEVDGIKMIGNNRTGRLIGLTQEGENLVKEIENDSLGKPSEENLPLYQALLDGNYFLKDTEEEVITSAYIHVTDNCNLHCVGCYSFVEERNKKRDLSFEEICYILDQLKENQVRAIVISGGEPFFRDDIDKICQYAKFLGFLVQIITNGTMPKEKYLKAIPYIDAISVSVDGYNADTHFIRDCGIMEKVLSTVQFLKEHTDNVRMIFTLHKKNAKYMKEYLNMSKELGVNFNFSMLTASPNNTDFQEYLLGKEEFILMEKFLKENKVTILDSAMESEYLSCKARCGAGKLLVSIGADGTIYPCHMLHMDEFKMGNILSDSLHDIVYNENNPFLNLDVTKINGCKECKYKFFCGGGCRARSYYKKNSIYEKCDVCDTNFKFLDGNFQALKKEYSL